MSLTIRLATADDLPDLLRLNAQVHELHVAAKPQFFKSADPEEMASLLAERLACPNTTVTVADDGEQTAGYLVAKVRERPANPFSPARRWTELEEIGVAPERRRQGVARLLIETVVAEAQHAGIDNIELTAWSFNEVAQRALQQMGFVPQNTRMTYGK